MDRQKEGRQFHWRPARVTSGGPGPPRPHSVANWGVSVVCLRETLHSAVVPKRGVIINIFLPNLYVIPSLACRLLFRGHGIYYAEIISVGPLVT